MDKLDSFALYERKLTRLAWIGLGLTCIVAGLLSLAGLPLGLAVLVYLAGVILTCFGMALVSDNL